MFDNEGHWIDDPLMVVNAKPDFSGLGMKPIHKKKKVTMKHWKYLIAGIIAGIIIGVLCSCNVTRARWTQENIDGTTFDVAVIDSCEYLIGNAGYNGYMAHKGNCKYCEQRRKN